MWDKAKGIRGKAKGIRPGVAPKAQADAELFYLKLRNKYGNIIYLAFS
jgi:hypothetical protein